MQKSENESKTEETVKRSVWTVVGKDAHSFVPRCSVCGYFKKELRMHWFFSGLYCRACIQDILYDNCRTIEEIEK